MEDPTKPMEPAAEANTGELTTEELAQATGGTGPILEVSPILTPVKLTPTPAPPSPKGYDISTAKPD